MANYLDTVAETRKDQNEVLSRLQLFASGIHETEKSGGIKLKLYAARTGIVLQVILAISTIAFAILLGINTMTGITVALAAIIPLAAIYFLGKQHAKLNTAFNAELAKIKRYLNQFNSFLYAAYCARANVIHNVVNESLDNIDKIINNEDQDLQVVDINLKLKDVIALAKTIKKQSLPHSSLSKEFKELKHFCELFLKGIGKAYDNKLLMPAASLLRPKDYIPPFDRLSYNLFVMTDKNSNRFKTEEQLAAESKLITEKRTVIILTVATVALAALGAVGMVFSGYFLISAGLLAAASVPFLAFVLRNAILRITIKREEAWVVREIGKMADDFEEAHNITKAYLEDAVVNEKWAVSDFNKKFDAYMMSVRVHLQHVRFSYWREMGLKIAQQVPLYKGGKFVAPFNRLLNNATLFICGEKDRIYSNPHVRFYSDRIKTSDNQTLIVVA